MLKLLVSCTVALTYAYAYFCLLSLSFAALATFFSLIGTLFIGICTLRIRRAETSCVERILGPLWGAFGGVDQIEDSSKTLKIIAHRACGIDAPENSISALVKVTFILPNFSYLSPLRLSHLPLYYCLTCRL